MCSLLEKLGGEKRRWEVQIKEMSAELQALPLHALLVRYACYNVVSLAYRLLFLWVSLNVDT